MTRRTWAQTALPLVIASAAVAPSVVTPKDTVAISGVVAIEASPVTVMVASAKAGAAKGRAKAVERARAGPKVENIRI